MATNSIILLLVLSISCQCSTRDVYIQPSEGEHCPGTCYNITTLGKMAENFSNSSGLAIHFSEGTHLLDLQELLVFNNLTNAVFEGDGRMEQGFHETVWQSTVVIKCTEYSSTGIAFVNSSNITFRYITITNCGAYMTMYPFHFKHSIAKPPLNASLGYLSVGNGIVIDHVSVQNGSGSGLLVITEGVDLTITNSSFAQNGYPVVGSNVFIMYFDPNNCTPQKNLHKIQIAKTNVSFGNCKLKHHFTGEGLSKSGLSIHMFQGSYGVAIVIDSVIAYGNIGLYGNIFIFGKENEFPTYNLTINNLLSSNSQGPALAIKAANYSNQRQCHTFNRMVNLTILIANSKFTNNKNYKGKQIVVVLDFVGAKFTSTVVIESIEISHNIGAGLEFRHASHDTKVFVTMSNMIANNNSLSSFTNNDDSIAHKLFVVGAIDVTSLVLNNVSITNNKIMTGLFVYRTVVIVNGTSVFHNNTGIDGGGLAMYGDSYFLLKEFSFLNFTKNKAKRGGAIFVASQLEQCPCFFQYIHEMFPKSAKVAFFNNKALSRHSSVWR